MSLQNKLELEVTRKKLRELQQLYDKTQATADKSYADELTQRSLKRTMNQLKEEIARFEAKASTAAH
jgi:hypothetical protein